MKILIALTLLAASHRNPFQFVETPQPQPKPVRQSTPPQPVIVQPPAIVEARPITAQLPEFPYHLIGRFGVTNDPIVAFVGKGQVITVKNGDTIDDAFIVRNIGIESVEIGFVNRSETLRLQLDGSV